jgi:hypothetical protein
VNDTLWYSLVIKVGDLLAEREIFQERRTPASGFQRILVVRDDDALIGGERRLSAFSRLVRSASWISDEVLLRIFEILKALPLACFFTYFCH